MVNIKHINEQKYGTDQYITNHVWYFHRIINPENTTNMDNDILFRKIKKSFTDPEIQEHFIGKSDHMAKVVEGLDLDTNFDTPIAIRFGNIWKSFDLSTNNTTPLIDLTNIQTIYILYEGTKKIQFV